MAKWDLYAANNKASFFRINTSDIPERVFSSSDYREIWYAIMNSTLKGKRFFRTYRMGTEPTYYLDRRDRF